MPDFLLIREIILFAGLLLASYTDLKKGIISDKLNYALAGLGIVLTALEFNWLNFVIPVIVFVFFAFVYYLGKIGGGDVKLFTAVSFLFPVYQNQIFLLPALFYSAIVSVLFLSTYYVLKYAAVGIDWKENKQGIQQAFVLFMVLLVYLAVLIYSNQFSFSWVVLFFVPLFFGLVFVAFQQGIKKNFPN